MPKDRVIKALRVVADEMGDYALVELCDAALRGSQRINRAEALETIEVSMSSLYDAWWSRPGVEVR